jgi:hypothetical protein
MAYWIYVGIACGCHEATGKFWKSVGWPLYLGEMIGKEMMKREAGQ